MNIALTCLKMVVFMDELGMFIEIYFRHSISHDLLFILFTQDFTGREFKGEYIAKICF